MKIINNYERKISSTDNPFKKRSWIDVEFSEEDFLRQSEVEHE